MVDSYIPCDDDRYLVDYPCPCLCHRGDPSVSSLAFIVFLYYTSVWAVVSTFVLHITRQLHLDPVAVAWFLTSYGLATVLSEAVLVRLLVPTFGELNCIRIGLLAFSAQTACISFSPSVTVIVISVCLSTLANLVYPSVSGLVSRTVSETSQGEALGLLNGIKALTEGFGPLTFGWLMQLYERTDMPGTPYILASFLTLFAFLHSFELSVEVDSDPGELKGRRWRKRVPMTSVDDVLAVGIREEEGQSLLGASAELAQ